MRRILLAILLITIGVGSARALSKAEVRAIVEREYPGARVTEVERERYRGDDIWEVDFRHEGQKLEAIISLDGEIIRVHIDD